MTFPSTSQPEGTVSPDRPVNAPSVGPKVARAELIARLAERVGVSEGYRSVHL